MSLTKEDLQAIGDLIDSKLNAAIASSEERMVRQFGVIIESKVVKELKTIQEGITGWNDRNHQIDRLEYEVEEHDHRIFALEQVAKK